MHKSFRNPKFSETPEVVTSDNFCICETKSFRLKIGITPSIHNFFPYQKVFETWKGSLTKFFCNVVKKISTEYRDNLFSIKIFSVSKIFWQNGCFAKLFISILRRRKLSTESWCFVLFVKIVDAWNFLKHKRLPLGNLSAKKEKKLLNKKQWYILLMHQSFWCPNFSKHRSVL